MSEEKKLNKILENSEDTRRAVEDIKIVLTTCVMITTFVICMKILRLNDIVSVRRQFVI